MTYKEEVVVVLDGGVFVVGHDAGFGGGPASDTCTKRGLNTSVVQERDVVQPRKLCSCCAVKVEVALGRWSGVDVVPYRYRVIAGALTLIAWWGSQRPSILRYNSITSK